MTSPSAATWFQRSLLATALATAVLPSVATPQIVPPSQYGSLPTDLLINQTQSILQATVQVNATSGVRVLLESDGRFFPAAAPLGAASVHIAVDGVRVSNTAVIDWSTTGNPQQHSFNVIAAPMLSAGSHTISLVAEHAGANFWVGARSNLCVLTSPAAQVTVQELGSPTPAFDFTTCGTLFYTLTPAQYGVLPHTPFLTATLDAPLSTDVIALASATGLRVQNYGDSMLGLYLSNAGGPNPPSPPRSFAVNDLWLNSELIAPMPLHAYFSNVINGVDPQGGVVHSTVSLDGTEFPWCGIDRNNDGYPDEDGIIYSVASTAQLITLRGGMSIAGIVGSVDPATVPQAERPHIVNGFLVIGTTDPNNTNAPPANSNIRLSEADITVPTGHDGEVLFLAKARMQADWDDEGGTVLLWIEVRDSLGNVRTGSLGVQSVHSPSSVSQRTISASYLTAGSEALTPGTYNVRVYAKAIPTDTSGCGGCIAFRHVSIYQDTGFLVYLD